jgi:hypothetical protein
VEWWEKATAGAEAEAQARFGWAENSANAATSVNSAKNISLLPGGEILNTGVTVLLGMLNQKLRKIR